MVHRVAGKDTDIETKTQIANAANPASFQGSLPKRC